ncbi:hypothetical protein AMAG_20466 [Allomyces macrogynus ATCC 38327]|uniref:ATP-dependent DNA helicase n=1 Tax=Allomyces macrogynus (strain ATCC 38327) TaxID=578462 RepID=A0A0L0TAD5_ALLM3|nr:hypothetical protein AMAG_20466 [Allomyces macrogynus ATCC 38327]|eukprot:KNE71681.1 hypothetical protein AMAG_20466 [Allomyces macrogynus ATCC 38327]
MATTGIAAVSIDGQMVHRWAGFGAHVEPKNTPKVPVRNVDLELTQTLNELADEVDLAEPSATAKSLADDDKSALSPAAADSMRDDDVLIVDELSMMSASFLEKLNRIVQGNRDSKRFFGRMQVIFVGEFFQLPPVIKRRSTCRAASGGNSRRATSTHSKRHPLRRASSASSIS